jgi:hypothetical protein
MPDNGRALPHPNKSSLATPFPPLPPSPLNPRRQVKDILAKGGDTKQDGQIHSKSFIGILFYFIQFFHFSQGRRHEEGWADPQ